MKILQVLFHLSPGGAERFVVDLSNELAKTNDVTLMALKEDSSNPEVSLFYKFALSKRVRYINVGLSSTSYSPFTMWKVYKAIKTEHPDIVHMHTGGIPKFCYLANLLLGRKIRFIQTIHNDLDRGYSTWLYDFVHYTLGRNGLLRFVAISETNYRALVKRYPNTISTYIVNGRAPMMPTSTFNEVKKEIYDLKPTKETIVILHVARCNVQKNQTLLIQSFNELVKNNRDVILLIIGAGFDSELGKSLKTISKQNIHFLGTRKNICDYMLNADLFVLSSNFEGMPITVIEALMSGVPVVSTPVCGSIDAIDGENGEISADFTKASFVATLNKVLDNIHKYQIFAKEKRNEGLYTIKSCAEKYLQFYKQ